jgi:CRP-like cAMP-binding protein
VVLDGILVATGRNFARPDIRLLGAGDTIDARALTGRDVACRVLEPARVAILDERFVMAARRWPALMIGLARRLFESQREEHTRAAICTMPRVEERILALLCHLALRWGRVTPDGISLTLPITHEILGALIGARRPTVSLALVGLTEQQLVQRRDDGTWLLPPACRQWPQAGIPRDRPGMAA